MTLYQSDEEAKDNAKLLVDLGLAKNWDDAIHQMVDMGEISEYQHEKLLSTKERERIYG